MGAEVHVLRLGWDKQVNCYKLPTHLERGGSCLFTAVLIQKKGCFSFRSKKLNLGRDLGMPQEEYGLPQPSLPVKVLQVIGSFVSSVSEISTNQTFI